MDEKDNMSSSDEFHFSEAEETQEANPYELSEEEVGGKKKSTFSRRRILIAIGIIILALAIYKLIGVFFGASDVKDTQSGTVPSSLQAKQSEQTEQSTETVSTSETPQTTATNQQQAIAPTQTTSLSDSELQDRFDKLQSSDEAGAKQRQAIAGQLGSINASIQNLNQAVSEINQQLRQVQGELSEQESVIKALKRPKARKRSSYISKTHRRAVVPRPKWYIRAMIPGRAWLRNSKGKNISVQVNDLIKGYGRVKRISVVQGTVKLSTGAIIRYRDI